MRPEQISDALNQLDNDLIRETEQVRRLAKRRKKQPNINWQFIGTLAACICLLMIGNIVASKFIAPPIDPELTTGGEDMPGNDTTEYDIPESEDMTAESETEKPTAPTAATLSQETEAPATEPGTGEVADLPTFYLNIGMGSDGKGGGTTVILDDLQNWISSPWSEEMEFSTLPVYDNCKFDRRAYPFGLNREEMEAWASDIVDALDTELISMEYRSYQMADKDVTGTITMVDLPSGYVVAETEAATITIDGRDAKIEIKNILQEGEYWMKTDLTDSEARECFNRYIDYFADLLDFDVPIAVVEKSYTTGVQKRKFFVYDRTGDETENLLNHRYNRVEFVFSILDGSLSEVIIHNGLSTAEKLGDYPVISATEAKELLLAGSFFTEGTKSDYRIEEKDIAGVELMYPTSIGYETIIPYYCFYMELDEEPNSLPDGLARYRACYVPAIDSRYIENMPSYGGLSQ